MKQIYVLIVYTLLLTFGFKQNVLGDPTSTQWLYAPGSCILFMKHVGKHKPQGDGVLIFDEVKVACQLIWKSRSQTLSGLAMTSKDFHP